MNSIPALLQEYRDLELRSHVSLDDVLSKVTQEVAELAEAFAACDADATHKEAADVIVNVLSASSRLGALPDDFDGSHGCGGAEAAMVPTAASNLGRSNEVASGEAVPFPQERELLQLLGKWNQVAGALRGRYSRGSGTVSDLAVSTRSLVSAALQYTGRHQTVENIVQTSIAKFRDRVDAYKGNLSLEDYIRPYSDFPKPWITFRDISPMLASPEAMRFAAFELAYQCRDADVIAGLDARGFLFGIAVADILQKPFVMIRKKGKLPGATVGTDYSLEYGDNSIEIQREAIVPGQRVAIIDDLLATGGTFAAAASLVEKVGGKVDSLLSVIALDEPGLLDCPARKRVGEYRNGSLVRFG